MINIQPRTRQEREALRDKDRIEKSRIDLRVGFEARGLGVGTLIHQAPPQSTLYVPENERFDKDFAVADKNKGNTKFGKEKRSLKERDGRDWIEKLKMGLLRKSGNQRLSETHEPHSIINSRKKEFKWVYQEFIVLIRLAYNPITLKYDNSEQGNILRQFDEKAKVRQFVRAHNLDTRGNTGFNILTGEQRGGVDQIVPNHLRTNYQQRLREADDQQNIKHYAIQQQLLNQYE